MNAHRIRPAAESDVDDIVDMVYGLAEYEGGRANCQLTTERLSETLFCPAPRVFCHVSEVDTPSESRLSGCALWFLNYSTWTGTHGIHLEDLFVHPRFRGEGAGRALLAELAAICRDRGYARFEWAVLDWNTPSIAFYDSLGAQPQHEWINYRLTGERLIDLAATRSA